MATPASFAGVHDDSESQDATDHMSRPNGQPYSSMLNGVDSFLSQQYNENSRTFLLQPTLGMLQQSQRGQAQSLEEILGTGTTTPLPTSIDPTTVDQDNINQNVGRTARPDDTISLSLEDRFAEIAPSTIPALDLEHRASDPLPGDVEEGSELDEVALRSECDRIWILNFTMIKRDGETRWEKFFVTYIETPTHWRRVTIPMDYKDVPPSSLEEDLETLVLHSDKHLHIFRSLRDCLDQIEWYPGVTRLQLVTSREDGELNINVQQDGSELIEFPSISSFGHVDTRHIKECEVEFDAHLSGYVFKVRVQGEILIKKEIPNPEAIPQFQYEINALDTLDSPHVAQLEGLVTDNGGKTVKALLITYASKGALIDILWDMDEDAATFYDSRREKWGQQIIRGLSDLHEAGFVHGDFTLSNLVVDESDSAQIIDINRRGCPIGCEPPELRRLMENNQSITMSIGVKTDLFQLGMVLWALATGCSQPDCTPKPLPFLPGSIPKYFRNIVEACLSDRPEDRCGAKELLTFFETTAEDSFVAAAPVDVWSKGHADLPSSSSRTRTMQQQNQQQELLQDVDDEEDILSGLSSYGYNVDAEPHQGIPVTAPDVTGNDPAGSLVSLGDFDTLDFHRHQSSSSTSWHADSSTSWMLGRRRGRSQGERDNVQSRRLSQEVRESEEEALHENEDSEDGDRGMESGTDSRSEYDSEEEEDDDEANDEWSQQEASRGSSLAREARSRTGEQEEPSCFSSAAEEARSEPENEEGVDSEHRPVPGQSNRRKRSWSGRGADDTNI